MFNFLSKNSVKKISPKEAKEKLASDHSIVLLDVREEWEYLEEHIPNSINLPIEKIATVEEVVPDKNTTVFIYCLKGIRAGKAAREMGKMGYENVYNLGGIKDWPYETGSGK